MERKFVIIDPVGIHARPATLIVNEASKYASNITLKFEDREANLKSIMGIMGLGISAGKEISIVCEGPDEEKAIDGLTSILSENNIAEGK